MARRQPPPTYDLDRIRLSLVMTLAKEWGSRVRARRIALGLGQAQVAELVGTTIQTISKLERGEIVARDYLKIALAVRLHAEVDELFPWPARSELESAA